MDDELPTARPAHFTSPTGDLSRQPHWKVADGVSEKTPSR